MRYFLHLAYQGTNYSGWQRQTTAISVQEVVEDSISKILKRKIHIHGCGRTDSGVHASQYFAHLDIECPIEFDFVERLNLVLPEDISAYDLIPVEDTSHAQYDAKLRTYTYNLHTKKIPVISTTSAYYNINHLDVENMQKAIEILKSTSDFRSLCKNPDIYKHTLCKIKVLQFKQLNMYEFQLIIKADRFLRGMIRYIVARLLDVGTGKLSVEIFEETILNRSEFGFKFHKKAHPQGLYLSKIQYPYLEREVF